MQIKEYLERKQPFVYKTFLNAIKNNQLSHAYLLVGDYGTPLKETAIYLAKSLVCDQPNPLACENCITCLRIENNQYADIIIEDGSKNNIKKEEVSRIIETFSKTAIERKGKVIYIIHLIETLKPVVINGLLKFLEEPGKNTYAFLTTQNEARVLPTIISRCQRLVLRLSSRNNVIKEALELSIAKDDTELLSYLYNDAVTIQNFVQTEKYKTIKNIFNEFIKRLDKSDDLLYLVEDKLITELNNKEDARMFFDMLANFYEDIIRKKNAEQFFLTSYDKIITDLITKLPHPESTLLELITLRSQLDLNLNVPSAYEHLVYIINKE